jgi:hypothetical protein
MANTPNYDINYDDERFTQVESDRNAAINEIDKTYGEMIGSSDKFYQDQIAASQQWAATQAANQQAQTDFAIEKIEQQKQQAEKDYKKEQSGAYVDWQKQSNAYGAEAEQMAAQGMSGTGYAESSQVSMYNTYQNRVATAREVFSRAILNYDNLITEAKLQNSSILAEIAYQAQQTQLELALQGFQYKNSLLIEKANAKTATEQRYYDRYQDVLDQINRENTLAEQVRQFEAEKAFKEAQLKQQREIADAQLAEEARQFDILHPTDTGSGDNSNNNGGGKPYYQFGNQVKDKAAGKVSKPGTNTVRKGTDTISMDIAKNGVKKVDTKSLNTLGASGVSPMTLNQMVSDGLIKEVMKKDGTLTFKRSGKALLNVKNKYLKW